MILVLDAAARPAVVALGEQVTETDAGGMAAAVASLDLSGVEAVAATVGPGSFTGLRAALSLAHGLAAAGGWLLVPVTVAEALREGEGPVWVALESGRGRVFLDCGQGMRAVDPASVACPDGPVLIAGDGAASVEAALASCPHPPRSSGRLRCRPADIAVAARRRLAGMLPELAPIPLYIDPVEAKLPAGGLRPAPA